MTTIVQTGTAVGYFRVRSPGQAGERQSPSPEQYLADTQYNVDQDIGDLNSTHPGLLGPAWCRQSLKAAYESDIFATPAID